jgi:hypothetical protein
MALKGKLGVFSCVEIDVIRLDLDLGVASVVLFDEVNKFVPILTVYNSFR